MYMYMGGPKILA